MGQAKGTSVIQRIKTNHPRLRQFVVVELAAFVAIEVFVQHHLHLVFVQLLFQLQAIHEGTPDNERQKPERVLLFVGSVELDDRPGRGFDAVADHFVERLKIYAEEEFDYEVIEVDVV